MEPCLPILHQLAYYFSGLTLGALAVFIGFRAYYRDLYRVKRPQTTPHVRKTNL